MTVTTSAELARSVESAIQTLGELHNDIGLSEAEREARVGGLYKKLSQCLVTEIKAANTEKDVIIEECKKTIESIRQIERSIYDGEPTGNANIKITKPFIECLKDLREKKKAVIRLHAERFEQVKELSNGLAQYAAALEPSFLRIELPPKNHSEALGFNLSLSYADALDKEFSRVYNEYNKRIQIVQQIATDIVQLWAELGTHALQTDKKILQYYRDAPQELGLREEEIRQLENKKRSLMKEKNAREKKCAEVKERIGVLWEKLGEEQGYRNEFLAAHRSFDQRTINGLEEELGRLLQLKQENLHVFVEDARHALQRLWDELYFSEDEMCDFAAAFTEEYTDALLSIHENEIVRLEKLKAEQAPILALVDKHQSLLNEREELAASANDASRLMSRGGAGQRDPTRLLREEKMRKRIQKELPKVEAELKAVLRQWEEETGTGYMVRGEVYLDTLTNSTLSTAAVGRSRSTLTKPTAAKAPPQPQRAQSVKTIASTGTMRGRGNSVSASSYREQQKQEQNRPPSGNGGASIVRPKSTGPRPKTPVSSMGPPPRPGTTHSTRPKTPTATIGRKGGAHLLTAKTPTRTARPPLGNIYNDGEDTEKEQGSGRHTIRRAACTIGRSGIPASMRADTPKMGALHSSASTGTMRNSDQGSAPRGFDRAYMQYSVQARAREEEEQRRRAEREGSEDRTSQYSHTSNSSHTRSLMPSPTFATPNYNSMHSPAVTRVHSHNSNSSDVPPRMFSGTSSSSSNTPSLASGSENWETFDETSEDEGYYPPPTQRAHQKMQLAYRGHPNHGPQGKQCENINSKGQRGSITIVNDENDYEEY